MKSDLEGNLAKPKSAIGMIVAALRQRREQGTRSFTVLSCDNLPENGDKVSTGQATQVSIVLRGYTYRFGCETECYCIFQRGGSST